MPHSEHRRKTIDRIKVAIAAHPGDMKDRVQATAEQHRLAFEAIDRLRKLLNGEG